MTHPPCLRLCPAHPGNPCSNIEGESPLAGKVLQSVWLWSCDRIALDCYRATYTGLGRARSVPAPPPFSYMRPGFAPATFRRGIPLTRLGRQLNPFPLIQLPYHRLVNPWTLGAVLHEVSHNLQSDLGLARHIPR